MSEYLGPGTPIELPEALEIACRTGAWPPRPPGRGLEVLFPEEAIWPTWYPCQDVRGANRAWRAEKRQGATGGSGRDSAPEPARSLIVGDLGPDQPVGLDLARDAANPPVMYLTGAGRWVEVAGSLLGLLAGLADAANRPTLVGEHEDQAGGIAYDYLAGCLPAEPFTASGVGIKTAAQIDEENQPWVSPAGVLNRFGFVVVATSIGGNAVVLDLHGPGLFWADRSRFVDAERLEYIDPRTGGWTDPVEYSREAVRQALDVVDADAVAGLHRLLTDQLTAQLDERDLG